MHGYSSPFQFQGVHETFTLGPVTAPRTASDPIANTLVFIGVNLNKAAIQEVSSLARPSTDLMVTLYCPLALSSRP